MVGEHCSRQPAGSEDNCTEQDMDCEHCLFIDESSRNSGTGNYSSQSEHSSPVHHETERLQPEPVSDDSDLFRGNSKKVLNLPKNPKSSLSKLESLVKNLMKRKTEDVAKAKQSENGKRSVAESTRHGGPSEEVTGASSESTRINIPVPLATGVGEHVTRSVPSQSSRRQSFQRMTSVPDFQPSIPLPPMPNFPPMIPGTMPPFMTPFGFPPFGFPPFVMAPTMSRVVVPRSASHATGAKTTVGKTEHARPVIDLPLDLTTSGKKRHPEPGYPEHDASRLGANYTIRAASGSNDDGSPQVHVPQLVKPNRATKSEAVVSSPTPSVLPRSGKSAFMNVSSPIAFKQEWPPVKKERSPPPVATDRSTHVKEISVYEHNVLQTEFHDASRKPKTGAAIRRLQQTYRREVDRIELDRQEMMAAVGDPDKSSLRDMFDNQRLLLAKQFKLHLAEEKLRFGMTRHHQSLDTMPSVMPFCGMPFNSAAAMPASVVSFSGMPNLPSPMFPCLPQTMSGQQQQQQNQPASFICGNDAGSPSSSSGGELNSSDPSGESQRGQKRNFHCPSAVSVLNQWYDDHFDHPYPDETTVEDLAKKGNITPPQVKKWMANKRVRSYNTLAFNGSIHPKKLQKLMQLKESNQQHCSGGGLDLSVPSSVAESRPSASVPTPTSEKKSKRSLDPRAVDYMSNWYAEHLNYPYPTEDEKTRIAAEAGLSLPQVTCWFANKRNRSNNTRRISTKTMWQRLNCKNELLDTADTSLSVGVQMAMETNSVA